MYEKQTWKTGDVITEEKLNHIEDGIASCGMFVVGSTYDENTQTVTLDKTYKEIVDAFNAGQNVIIKRIDGFTTIICPLVLYGGEDNMFGVGFYNHSVQNNILYFTDSENGYPSRNENSSN